MSHHLDTPLAAKSGQLFIDDLYVFQGADSTVFIVDVNSNVNGKFAKPGFHPEARYEFKVHVDGAEVEDLTYRFSFGDPDADGEQPYRLVELAGPDASDDAADAPVLAEGPTGQQAQARGLRMWAGRIADSFYIDLSLLTRVNGALAGAPRRTCRTGARTPPSTASPAPPWTPSCSRSRTPTPSCGRAPASACGRRRSSRPTPAAGVRSTAPDIR